MKYEAHITVQPSAEHSYAEFAAALRELGWKPSMFEHDEVDDIAGKWFVSYASDDRDEIINEVKGMIHGLSCAGEEVLRWKIEQTLFDSKAGCGIEEGI
jgi:hypothetical protein